MENDGGPKTWEKKPSDILIRLRTMRYLLMLFAVASLVGCSEGKKTEVSYASGQVMIPELFAPGIISTVENDEYDLCFTPDGRTVYFTRRIPDAKQKIYRSDLVGGQWTAPQVAPFSSDRDETPYITPDGHTFYFGSEREIPGKPNKGGFDMNVWMMRKDGNHWTNPEPLPEPVNYVQIEGENWPSSNNNFFFTLDGKTHYFTTMMRGSNAIDIYTTELEDGQFSEPQPIEGLFENDRLWQYSASISPDGRFLVFNSYQAPGGKGGEDLYVSRKTPSGWSNAVSIGNGINTNGEESSGRFSPDGRYFFYTHSDNLGEDSYGPWSIYFVETEYLNLPSLFE